MQNSKCKISIQNSKIIENRKIAHYYYKIIVEAKEILRYARPGQFINLRVNNSYEPFLRRPFSIHRINGSSIEVLYEVIGRGTEILSQKKKGEYLDIIGPLGNGFDYHRPQTTDHRPILVAGGMGVAPLIFLAEKLMDGKPLVLIGAKTRNHILCEKEFKKLGCEVKISTDDGSKGFEGKVTGLLKNILRTTLRQARRTTIYACGPRPMLKEIVVISKKYNMPAQISLEEHLACGIGACLGCVVKTKEGYQRVCQEGPVFKADEIIW